MALRPPPPIAAIPAYALYGEANGDLPDGVHVETIRARSARLDWRIAPHRHAGLYQSIWIASGSARAHVEGVEIHLAAGDVLFLPPLVVHSYVFSEHTAGIVVSMPKALIEASLSVVPEVVARLSRAFSVQFGMPDGTESHNEAGELFRMLLRDQEVTHAGSKLALNALATLLCLWLARHAPDRGEPSERSPGLDAVRRFLAEVERDYAQRRLLADYAKAVGVSAPHLGRLCRRIAGRAPMELVLDRRLVEAKRLLTYTGAPVAEIADRLGFDSAAYFSRFFAKRTGLAPVRFRKAAEMGERARTADS